MPRVPRTALGALLVLVLRAATPCSASLPTWRVLHDPIFAPLRGDPRFERLWNGTRPQVPWLEGNH